MHPLVSHYRQIINAKIPAGSVVTRHNEKGHFYEVVPLQVVLPSVTGKIQIVKDESLGNFRMNQAIEYFFAHFKELTDANIMEFCERAAEVSIQKRDDAGDIGTRIHDYRQRYFDDWIREGRRPENILSYLPPEEVDLRATSGLRALDKFINEKDYIPVACELFVYDAGHKLALNVAGTLDDIGLMRRVIRPGDANCGPNGHSVLGGLDKKYRCVRCEYKYTYDLVLMDIKTSNQFKDHYFFQVALYYQFFKNLTGLKPRRCFILKLSKEDGTYKLEDLRQLGKLIKYARHMVMTDQGVDFIKSLRKDNQKTLISL